MSKKKKCLIAGLFLAVVLLGITGFTAKAYSASFSSEEEAAVTIEAGKGETLMYASLLTVVGNEATLEPEEGDTVEVQIPVGTPVITKHGVTTTFLRLSGGDQVAVLMEEASEEIKKIWIVG